MTENYNDREQAQWRKGKTPIIRKYIEDHTAAMSAIAGRGFLSLPGYGYDMENSIETGAKTGLSELNYKILAETIDRELKQSGIDYNLEYKVAAMTWELEKQALMAAWDAELAGIKQGMASDEETLNQLSIQVSLRQITLLDSRTAIEVSMEADRTTLASLEGNVAPYEAQLANAKLLTAQKKLDLIPVLQEIISKEQDLLVIEQQKATAMSGLMAAEQELVAKKQTLVPYTSDLAAQSETYAQEVTTVEIPTETEIANEKINHENIAVQKSDYKVQEETADVTAENKKLDLLVAKRALEKTQFSNEQTVATQETALLSQYSDDEAANFNALLQERKDNETAVLADKATAHSTSEGTRTESVATITGAEGTIDTLATHAEITRMTEVAELQAATTITAQLKHIIGQ